MCGPPDQDRRSYATREAVGGCARKISLAMPHPGWSAIHGFFEEQYPGTSPIAFRSLMQPEAEHPCKQVEAWPAPGHWHLVGYGLRSSSEK